MKFEKRFPSEHGEETGLAGALSELGRRDQRSTPEQVHLRLLDEFREMQEARQGSTVFHARRWNPRWAGVAAALLLCGVAGWLLFHSQSNTGVRTASADGQSIPAVQVAAGSEHMPIGEGHTARTAQTAKPLIAARPAARNLTGHRLQKLAKTHRGHVTVPAALRNSLALVRKGWIPLPYSNPMLPLKDAAVVPVQLSATALGALGVHLSPGMTAASQRGAVYNAELLIGADNFARAIHFDSPKSDSHTQEQGL